MLVLALAPAAFQQRVSPRTERIRTSRLAAADFAPVSEIVAAQKRAAQTASALAEAVKVEDYATAGRLKEELKAHRAADPVYTLREQLAQAVKREDFSAAQELQSQLDLLREARPGLLWRNEVLVLTAGGKALSLVSGDGGPDATPRTIYAARPGALLQQPCWSPCGERIAVSEVVPSSDTSRVLVLSARDGSEVASAPTPPVFFLYYAPSGDVVTFLHAEPNLRAGSPTLVMGALDVARSKASYVAPGGPLYYSLSKAPGGILIHNGFLSEITYSPDLLQSSQANTQAAAAEAPKTAATPMTLCSSPASFRAPSLLGEDSSHAVFIESGGALVAVELATGERSKLYELGGGDALLVASPDACSLLVMHAVKQPDGTFSQELLLLQAGPPEELVDPQPSSGADATIALPSCRVAHRLDASAASATLCAFFSPDGKKLLCLEAPQRLESAGDDPKDSVEQRGRMRLMWTVWMLRDKGKPPIRRAFDPFVPSAHFLRSVVPFFDQYALASCSPWGPDSRSWCYATADGTVKVQRLEDDSSDAGGGSAGRPLDTSALDLAAGVLASPTTEQLAKAAELGLLVVAPDAETLEAPEADLVLWSLC